MVRARALEFKSEDPGFDPLMGQGETHWHRTVFLFLRVNSCTDLFVPDTPSCVQHVHACTVFERMLKIPNPSVVKVKAPRRVIWKHENIVHKRRKKAG